MLQFQWQGSLSVPPSTRSSMRSTFYQDSAKTKTNARRMCATPSGFTTLHATTGAWVLGQAVHLYSIAHWMLMSTLDLCLYIVAQRTAYIGNPQRAFRRFSPLVLDSHTLLERKKIFSCNEKTCSLLPELCSLFRTLNRHDWIYSHLHICWIKYNFKGLVDLQKGSWWPSNRNRMFSACCVELAACVRVCIKSTLHLNGREKPFVLNSNRNSWLTTYEKLVRQYFFWICCAGFCHFVYLTRFGWVRVCTLCKDDMPSLVWKTNSVCLCAGHVFIRMTRRWKKTPLRPYRKKNLVLVLLIS